MKIDNKVLLEHERFKDLYLKNQSSVDKNDYDELYDEYKVLVKKYIKLNKRYEKIAKISDKQLFRKLHENEKHTIESKRFHQILRHSDRQGAKLLDEKSELEVQVEKDIENEKSLIQEIEDTQKEVVFTMGSIGESRSQETGNHVKRVAKYSKLLAIYYGLSEDEVNILEQASPMHDIGKVAIADSILNKPAKLTKDEFELMKKHAEIGYEMLNHSSRPLLKAAAIVASEHHEKFDGTGYPKGLAGDEIHIYGRITALADVFDALGSQRIYKKAWDDDDIFAFLKEQRGKHFDPKLIDMFFKHLDEFLDIREEFKDTFKEEKL